MFSYDVEILNVGVSTRLNIHSSDMKSGFLTAQLELSEI